MVSSSHAPLTGVRVGVASDVTAGFTVSRSDGWFDLMVNGGGAVTLQFRRDPFKVSSSIRGSYFVDSRLYGKPK